MCSLVSLVSLLRATVPFYRSSQNKIVEQCYKERMAKEGKKDA